ncbi:MAG TPA: CdaR family protein [Roseiflexaceae bacterium]|nr:CdaR family protein [Roseiflexaceae bacterium]
MTWLRTTGLRLALSLGLAFSLWAFVSFSENPDRSVQFDDIAVTIDNLEPGLLLVDANGSPRGSLATISVTVTAEDQTINSVRSSDVRAFVDLDSYEPGDFNVPIKVVPNRSGLSNASLTPTPDRVPIRIERELTRTVPLTVEVSGTVPFSFRSLPPQISSGGEPISQVTVRGPAPRVEQVVQARAPANIDRLTANYSSPRPVEPVDTAGLLVTGVAVEPETVDVLVPIVSSAGTKRVPVVPQVIGQPASGTIAASVEVDPAFVVLTGSAGRLDDVELVETTPVDIAGASTTFTRTVDLVEPAGAVIEASQPRRAVVTVRIRPLQQPFRVTLPAQVLVINVPDGLLVSFSPQVLQLTISGTAAQLAALEQATLSGTISLRGLTPGVYTFQPSVPLPEGLSIVGPVPRVTVSLRSAPTSIPQPTPATPAPEDPTSPADRTPEQPTAAPSPTAAAPTPDTAAQPTAAPASTAAPTSPPATPSSPPPAAPTETPGA